MFSAYDPDNFIGNIEEELQSSEVSKQVTEDIQSKIDKWKDIPNNLQTSIDGFSGTINKVVNTNWAGLTNLKDLQSALETTKKAISEGKKLTNTIESSTKDLLVDVNDISGYVSLIGDTVKSDIALVDSKINNIKYLFSVEGFSQIMNDGVQSMLYDIFGKYYTYFLKLKDLASSVTEKKDELTESVKEIVPNQITEAAAKVEEIASKEIKPKKERLKGRDVYYKKDTIPGFLIENVHASGYEKGTENLLFEAKVKELCFDHNVREKPTELSAFFKINEHQNNAALIIDARKTSTKPLIYGDYFGTGFPIASDAEVFKIDTLSNIDADISMNKNGVLGIGGILDMDISNIVAMDLENEKVNELYQKALSRVKELSLGFSIDLGLNGVFDIKLKNPEKLVTQLSEPVASVFVEEIESITQQAKDKASEYISKNSDSVTQKLEEFNKIKDLVQGKKSALDSLNEKLEEKKKELSDRIEELTKKATSDALKSLGVPSSNDNSKKNSTESLKNLKNLFN